MHAACRRYSTTAASRASACRRIVGLKLVRLDDELVRDEPDEPPGPLHRRGEGEARLGDERGRVRAGDLALIPAMVPHRIANTGDERLKVVGTVALAVRTAQRSG